LFASPGDETSENPTKVEKITCPLPQFLNEPLADQNAGTADRLLADARGTEDLLADETARAVQAERQYDVPERLSEHTKAELLDIAHPLEIQGAGRMTKDQLVRSIQRASRAKART